MIYIGIMESARAMTAQSPPTGASTAHAREQYLRLCADVGGIQERLRRASTDAERKSLRKLLEGQSARYREAEALEDLLLFAG